MRQPGPILQQRAAVIFFLIKAPRTIPEIARLLNPSVTRCDKNGAVRKWLLALQAEGPVEVDGKRASTPTARRPARIWKWVG